MYSTLDFDGLVKSTKSVPTVIPPRIGVRDDGHAGHAVKL